MRSVIALVLIFLFEFSEGQGYTYPSIKAHGRNFSDFIPVGWTILDSSLGDMNGDGAIDAAIIVQSKDSVTLIDSDGDTILAQPRMLLLLFKKSSENLFYLKEQSNSFILVHKNPQMDDPYDEIKIENGILKISFRIFMYSGGWDITNSSYKFRFQNNQFYLIGAEMNSFNRSTHDFEDFRYNFLTKKRSLIIGNDRNKTNKTSWKTIRVSELKTLKTFTEPFSWEVEEDVTL